MPRHPSVLLLLLLLLPPVQDAFTGVSWTNLTANAAGAVAGFVDWGWGVTGCSRTGTCSSAGLSETTVFATVYDHPGDWDVAWDPDVHFVRSDDFFKSIKIKVLLTLP
jgi:hypothetical protein